ncbi:MAG: lipoate--protein ligase [Firmicutes bacterium]|nr:lipoate--protein ligase [Bacillota bacterium]
MLLIINDSNNAYYNLAAEEYLIDSFDEDIVMLWRNDNTVVVGKNQNTIEEIDSRYVEEHDISVVRRLTGGGAVFHDMGNVNYTIIQPYREGLFSNYAYFTEAVRDFLQQLGVSATLSGRNDLMIDGKKFSGNAQCVRKGRMMHHGTLMFSSDVKDISGALTPNRKKTESKGVKSVQSHVTNISSHLPEDKMSVEDFMEQLHRYFLRRFPEAVPYELTKEDKASIQQLSDQKYSTWEWNYGASPAFAVSASRKYDFGLVDVRLDVTRGRIREIRIFGDFFGIKSVSELEELLVGTEYRADAISQALADVALGEYISGMTAEELTELMMQ